MANLTTVAWWGFAYMLVAIAGPGLGADHALKAIAVVALVSGFLPLLFTKGRHLSWLVFFIVAALALLSLP
jgi:hypothetical protein